MYLKAINDIFILKIGENMGRSETIAQINKIKNNYDAFQSQIYELASKISSFSDEINEIDYRTIKHETTISLINASMNKINGDVNNIISKLK